MISANETRERLDALVRHFADEALREGAETLTTAHGMGVASLSHHLGLLLNGATPANLATVRPDRVGYGARVLLQDVDTRETHTHHLMSSQAMEFDGDHVSLESPLGVALLGRESGDTADVTTPTGYRHLSILAVRSLLDFLEVLDPRTSDLAVGV